MPGIDRQDADIIIATLITFVIAITIHEFMHAWTALQLGDDTALRLGRISLNPIVHFDPIGFLGFVLIALGYPAFAWGKPVPVNPGRLRPVFGRNQLGMAVVALAGPASNVVLALCAAVPLRLAHTQGRDLGDLEVYMRIFVLVNVGLAAFNMIPVPPLDGSKILMGLLPRFWTPIFAPLEQYGFLILILLIFVGGNLGDSIIFSITDPVFDLLTRVVYGSETIPI